MLMLCHCTSVNLVPATRTGIQGRQFVQPRCKSVGRCADGLDVLSRRDGFLNHSRKFLFLYRSRLMALPKHCHCSWYLVSSTHCVASLRRYQQSRKNCKPCRLPSLSRLSWMSNSPVAGKLLLVYHRLNSGMLCLSALGQHGWLEQGSACAGSCMHVVGAVLGWREPLFSLRPYIGCRKLTRANRLMGFSHTTRALILHLIDQVRGALSLSLVFGPEHREGVLSCMSDRREAHVVGHFSQRTRFLPSLFVASPFCTGAPHCNKKSKRSCSCILVFSALVCCSGFFLHMAPQCLRLYFLPVGKWPRSKSNSLKRDR